MRRVWWTWLLGGSVKSSGIAWLRARHDVLDHKYAVTKPLVLTVSDGKCVAAMISLPSQQTHFVLFPKIFPPLHAIADPLHRGRSMPWILERTGDSWFVRRAKNPDSGSGQQRFERYCLCRDFCTGWFSETDGGPLPLLKSAGAFLDVVTADLRRADRSLCVLDRRTWQCVRTKHSTSNGFRLTLKVRFFT